MSVRNPNTLASTIYDKLHLEINKKEIIEKWFIRIITLEFLNAKQIKPFILNDYKKEEIISLSCKMKKRRFRKESPFAFTKKSLAFYIRL